MKLTERMKACKSRSYMLVPIEIYIMDFTNVAAFVGEPVGYGYVMYHPFTLSIESVLMDNEHKPYEIQSHIKCKQDYQNARLVVYAEGVN